MRITSKGQVTNLASIRAQAGLLPHAEVAFEIEGAAVRIVPAPGARKPGRGARLVAHVRGRGDVAMSTDEIMALTRGIEGWAYAPVAASAWATISGSRAITRK